jgi:hypothetical protein
MLARGLWWAAGFRDSEHSFFAYLDRKTKHCLSGWFMRGLFVERRQTLKNQTFFAQNGSIRL